MATNFPNSLDSLTNPATTDQLNSPSHAAQHTNANDAIEQLQAKVGVNSSAVTTSHDYKIAQLEAAITAGVAGTKLIYQDVRNQSGVSLTKGTPVRVTGSDGASGKLLIGAASNSSEGGSSKTFGLLSSTLSNNSNGQVVTNGLLEGVDTTGAVDGDPVWLGVNGSKIFGLVNKPVAPAHLVYLGVVVRGGQQNTGSIFVSIQNGFEVDELHNVLINNTTLQNKDALLYDSTTQLWKNYDLSNDFVLSGDLQNSLGDYIPLSVLGEPDGVAKLDLDGNLIVPENKIIIEGATADAHELTIQAPDVTSDITVTLPNAAGTLALTSDITTAVNNLVNSAPNTLDTLNELATALGNDANFATTTATSIGNKVSKAGGDIITSSLPGVIGLTVKGAASQTANLQEWQDSAGTLVARVTSNGSTSWYGGFNQFLGDVRVGTSSYFNGVLSVIPRIITEVGISVRALSSQTANLMEFQNSSGVPVTFFNASGGLTATEGVLSTSYSGGKMTTGTLGYLNATTFNAAVSPVVVRGAASQTANLQEWQNSAGTVLVSVQANGYIQGSYINVTSGGGILSASSNQLYANNGSWLIVLPGPTKNGLIIKGAASQTADLQQWQNSAGTNLATVTSTGGFFTTSNVEAQGFLGVGGFASGSFQGLITNLSASRVGLGVKGAASQTANLQEWQNSAGTVLASINSSGNIYTSNGFTTPADLRVANGLISYGYDNTYSARIGVVAGSPTNETTLIVRKRNSTETGNFQEWQDSAGTVLAKVDASGAMFTTTAAANTNTTQVATTAYVQTELADLINSAPATLDTLKELSDALGADANFATTVTNNLALKAPLASPALTGTPTAPTAAVGTDSTQVATTAFVIDQIDASTQPGALYQTTAPTSPEIGQIWIDSDDNVTVFDSNIIRRQPFTATAGQTNFVTTVPFIDGFEQVYFNGLLLLKTIDYTTSGTNTVILGSAAAVNDIIEVVTVTNLNSVNTYTQAETDALLAANTSVAPLSISANTNLLAKKRYFVTSASALTLTLPASPALNDEIQILDASGNASTYNITVARNGNLINGNAGNLIIDVNGGWYTLLYTGATYGWKVA